MYGNTQPFWLGIITYDISMSHYSIYQGPVSGLTP